MPLNKLENFIKNYEGRILYVNSNDLDATDSITNQGNSLTKPFKTIQRALLEAARFSFVVGNNNDYNNRTTILVYPGDHVIDNRPGYGIRKSGTALATAVAPNGNETSPASDVFTLNLESNFDLTQENNILYKFNSVNGGVIIPRGTSLVGMDLRKTKIRPKYVPNPTDADVDPSAIFRITGECYFWQFSIFDGIESELVYTDPKIFTSGSGNLAKPTFSHHKLTCFEYADGVNTPTGYGETDLDMYYAKLSNAFNEGSGRQIPAAQKYPLAPEAFTKERAEWEIVGSFGTDPSDITGIYSGDGATPSATVTVTTAQDHGLTFGTPIKITGVNDQRYNVSTIVTSVTGTKQFTYILQKVDNNLPATPGSSDGKITIETDTVKGSSPYVFNCSLRSVYGMRGMTADGNKSDGFKSMVVAQFTGISLQKDDRAFVKYDPITRTYNGIGITKVTGADLSSGSSSTNTSQVYHLDSEAVYRSGWETMHITMKNDAVLQIVSVFAIGFNQQFYAESGGDASITNSNANFGQFALSAKGFKKNAFTKDNQAYITSIISPKSVENVEKNFDWQAIDVGLTTSVGITSHLYLWGFDKKDNVPPNLIQGYRLGARQDDRLYLTLPNGTTTSVEILMSDNAVSASSTSITGLSSSKKEYKISSIDTGTYVVTLGTNHKLLNGEAIILISDTGDLPENIEAHRKYYAITTADPTKIKLASSFTNAKNGIPLKIYGGTNVRILSRVSDRDSGTAGSPVQWDENRNNWFIHTSAANDVYTQVFNLGTVGFSTINTDPKTDPTFFKRVEDSRSIDEKVYKYRVVIPKEAKDGKDPTDGFVIQESSSTGPRKTADLNLTILDPSDPFGDFDYNRNPRFINTCTYDSVNKIVTVVAEQPHNLSQGDRVLVKNVKSSTNLLGAGVTGFNGDFNVLAITDDKTFTYSITDFEGLTHNVGIFSGITVRDQSIPRFERNDLQSNYAIYRSDVISSYEKDVQDGVYHLYVINCKNAIEDEFTTYKYQQNVTDFYPQLDRDNYNDNPPAATSYAKRAPMGEVVTDDLKKSITRETLDDSVKKFGFGPIISAISPTSSGVTTVTTSIDHGFNGVVGITTLTAGSGLPNGTYYNVKLLNPDSSWSGATAKIGITGGSVTVVEIIAHGSGYSDGDTLSIDGFTGASVGLTTGCISSPVNNAIQVTGVGTASDGLFRVTAVPSKNTVALARTTGDPSIQINQYLFNVGPSIAVSTRSFDATAGITTYTTTTAHGLVAGNKIRFHDATNNNLGDFIVNTVVGVNTVAITTNAPAATRLLKHGFNANDLTSDVDGENLGARGIPFFDHESAVLLEDISATEVSGISTFSIKSYAGGSGHGNVGIATTARYDLGSYIQVGNEIMRISTSTLSGTGSNEISALRGVFGTQKETHVANSLIRKIKPIPVELRRPSILRSSGQTFEYIGYGPGNYSTGLPQVQVRTLTDTEDYLAQAQEKSGGQVIYTGMNSDGDFFIGNTKYSAASGTQQKFDIPVSTVTGQDPSRLSVIFDEIIVKERILVEGGKSKQILSQFDGPVTFNQTLISNGETRVTGDLITSGLVRHNNPTQATSTNDAAVVIKGGVGIAKSLFVGGDAIFESEVVFNTGLVADAREDSYLGAVGQEWSGAFIAGIGIATEGVAGGTEAADRTIRAWTGPLILDGFDPGGSPGIVTVTNNFFVGGDATFDGALNITGITTFKNSTHHPDDIKATFGNTAAAPNMEIFHDSSANENVIKSGTGVNDPIEIAAQRVQLQGVARSAAIANFDVRNGVELFYNTGMKLNTSNTGVNVTGIVTATEGFFPDSDEGAPLGSAALPFSEAHIGEVVIAAGTGANDDRTITTASGSLFLDANGSNTVNVLADQLDVDNNLNVDGTSQFDDAVNMSTRLDVDNIRIDGNVISAQNTNGHVDLQANGTGDVRVVSSDLIVDENAAITGNISANGNATFGNASSDTHTFNGNVDMNHALTVDGNTTFGDASGDAHTFNGNVDMNHNLNVDGDTTLDDTDLDGALEINGRLDVDNIRIDGNTIQSTNSNGAITIDPNGSGDVNVEGPLDVNSTASFSGNVTFTSTTNNTLGNVNTGAVQLDGGMGIAGNLTVGGDINGNATSADTVEIESESNSTTWHDILFTRSTLGTNEGDTVNAQVFADPNDEIQYQPSTMSLRLDGDIIAFHSSDSRLKNNINPIEDALAKLRSISGNTFEWNEELSGKTGSDTGVIAQEIEAIDLPGVTTTRKNGYKAVKYERLTALLIEAVKELADKVDNLEQKISDK